MLSHKDLKPGKEVWLGPSHQQFCNRYLRRDDIVEVQHVRRYGKDSETQRMTINEFDE